MGRLLAVPLAVRFSTSFLVRANLLGCLLSSVLLLLAGRVSARRIVLARYCSLCGDFQLHFSRRVHDHRVKENPAEVV